MDFDNSDDDSSACSDDMHVPMSDEVSIRRDNGSDNHFTLLSSEAVHDSMDQIIRDVYQILRVPSRYLRIMLTHYKWDKDLLLERYYEGEPEQFLVKHHIPVNQWNWKGARTLDSSQLHLCIICYLNVSSQRMLALGCGHYFCTDCWRAYLCEKMRSEGQFEHIQCPAFNCKVPVDDDVILNHLHDPKLRSQFQKAVVTSFVTFNRRLVFCPGTDCEYVAQLTDELINPREACRITCKCCKLYCFACRQDWHEPVSCAMLAKWIAKNEGESMSTQWFMANTKECPKCHITIEKNGGCNHMVCRNSNCKHEFCWVCMDDWLPHGNQWYNCNRFDEERAEKVRKQQALSRNFLARYLHYYDLYMNHLKSLEFEARLQETVRQKMEEMQYVGLSWIEVKFLNDAVRVLCCCRRALMYTYVFAYYLKSSNQQTIFEDNQRNLQLATESLSEILERELDINNLSQLKQSVQDRYRYCESRASALLDHVYEGYRKDLWRYEFGETLVLNLR